ncbi:HSF-type DNA-binding protein [Nitzschia inconspicua]|uniref:HSF-type DNA-binding protein n=1 Tax=Nitzschia inconspicua TaxID=303405 RepID=A0A9K3KDQ2_9STRA|nr:HSF-type DNA-binding protein [Nitzschia inconspicua]
METQPKVDFTGLIGPAKRRRLRSGGGRRCPGTAATSKGSNCKGATTIPIFLKKTYKMIESCPTDIASWTPDGEMFVVKDPERFATEIIPQYFDHNKFSSFARQLNFYGFRKMQSKPIRNSDFDANTAKHVTFFNENFKRGRCDLLKKIQRSTRGGGPGTGSDQVKDLQDLREKVNLLETTISEMQTQHEERMRRLELDMLGRMEQMMMAIQQQQQNQQQLQLRSQNSLTGPASVTSDSNLMKPPAPGSVSNDITNTFDPLPFGVGRGQSIGSLGGLASLMGGHQASLGFKPNFSGAPGGGPTLPPHPKMKQLPTQNLPGSLTLPNSRLDSLRGISTLSRGISNLSRGLSTESQGSAILGNAFEDKFFSMLMNGGDANKAAAASLSNFMNPTPIQDQLNAANLARNNSLMNGGTATAATTGI